MTMWTMIFLIVLVSMLYSGWDAWLRHRAKVAKHEAGGVTASELEALRERLETLEAIVTNPEYDLKRQIDGLEEPPRNRSVG